MAGYLKRMTPFMFVCAVSMAMGVFPVNAGWLDKVKGAVETIGSKTGTTSNAAIPGEAEIRQGLKEALSIGADKVVSKLGANDGFNLDATAHIPLPESFNTAKGLLAKFGYGRLTDDQELRLNRAAEAAIPQAKTLFIDAIAEMSMEDAQAIYDGPTDAATRYFQKRMTAPLTQQMKPIVDNSMTQVGAVAAYDALVGQYKTIPYVPDIKSNLTLHVIEKALEGLFHYIAQEETAIRTLDTARTTELLKRVFSR